eukprot:4016483-Alexandrium_andersonii.AAC.2
MATTKGMQLCATNVSNARSCFQQSPALGGLRFQGPPRGPPERATATPDLTTNTSNTPEELIGGRGGGGLAPPPREGCERVWEAATPPGQESAESTCLCCLRCPPPQLHSLNGWMTARGKALKLSTPGDPSFPRRAPGTQPQPANPTHTCTPHPEHA